MTLSLLHVANGRIVDAGDNSVLLRGVNTAGFEFGNGSGGGMTQARVNAFAQNFSMNLWRLAINTSWWNNNVAMPWTSLLYQDWIQTVISWMKASGCYIEIDPTTVFDILPSSFPSQNAQDTPAKTQTQAIASITSFYQSFIPLYVNDPAVLYNAINEPSTVPFNVSDPIAGNNAIINVIQGMHPHALIFVYGIFTDQIASGALADYTQSNLVWDYHFYDDPTWSWRRKIGDWKTTWDYAQSHGHAVMIGEFNVSNGGVIEPEDFTQGIANLVLTRDFATAYYVDGDLLDGTLALTSQGSLLSLAYQNIAQSRYAPTVYANNPLFYYRLGDKLYSNDVRLDGFDADQSANYSQTFNDGGSVGTWTWDTTNSQITVTGGAEPVLVYSGTGASLADGFVEVLMNQAGNGGGLCGRRVNGNNVYTVYLFDSGDSSPNTFDLTKIVGGVYTHLVIGSISFTRGTFHVARLSVRGNVVTFYFDGVAKATVVDSSLSAAGSWGLIGGGGGGITKFQFMTVATYGAKDLSSRAQNGTLVGGVTLAQAGGLADDTDTAMLFNSSGISAMSAPLPTTATTNVSLSCWVNLPNSSVAGAAIMLGGGSNGYGIGFGSGTWDSTGTELIAGQEGMAWVPSPNATTLSTGVYHHIALVIDAVNTWIFYVDGVFVGSVAVGTSTIPPTGSMTIGGETATGERMLHATIDEAVGYGYALTSTQVRLLYQAGSSLPPGSSPPLSSPSIEWRTMTTLTLLSALALLGAGYGGTVPPGTTSNPVTVRVYNNFSVQSSVADALNCTLAVYDDTTYVGQAINPSTTQGYVQVQVQDYIGDSTGADPLFYAIGGQTKYPIPLHSGVLPGNGSAYFTIQVQLAVPIDASEGAISPGLWLEYSSTS